MHSKSINLKMDDWKKTFSKEISSYKNGSFIQSNADFQHSIAYY